MNEFLNGTIRKLVTNCEDCPFMVPRDLENSIDSPYCSEKDIDSGFEDADYNFLYDKKRHPECPFHGMEYIFVFPNIILDS